MISFLLRSVGSQIIFQLSQDDIFNFGCIVDSSLCQLVIHVFRTRIAKLNREWVDRYREDELLRLRLIYHRNEFQQLVILCVLGKAT